MSYLHEICLDEIALEGLDGITLACLWCRLDQLRPRFPLALDPKAKQFLWEGILTSQDVAFYRLPKPRELPTFPHEYMTTDESTGIVVLKEEVKKIEYPVCLVNGAENDGIKGSCATFKERVDISDEVRGHDGGEVVTLEEVQERWGDSLVLVASQQVRFSALVGPQGDSSLDLNGLRYCFLEYVGRQRHHGTQQVEFARLFKLSFKSLHNLRKDLMYHNLVDKKTCMCQVTKQLRQSILLTLVRFGPQAKHGKMSHHAMMSTNLIQLLEKQPKRTADFKFLSAELIKNLPPLGSVDYHKKCLRKTCVLLQKMNVLQVIHRATKVSKEVSSLKLLKKLSDDKDEAGEEVTTNHYDPLASHVVAELPILVQTYNFIERMQHTSQGISSNDLEHLLQKNSRFVRLLTDNNFLRNNLVKYTLSERGRQRTRKFQTFDFATESTAKEDSQPRTSTSEPKVPPQVKTTDRYMIRRQRILELIKENRVQEGCFGMLKDIRQEELQEGRTTKCDRKSVFRIVDQLEKEGLCKTFTTVVMSDDGSDSRTLNIVLDVGVEQNDAKVIHIIQQAKFRMISYKLHHPPNHVKDKRSKTGKKKKRSRITKYETLVQPEGSEVKARQAPSLSTAHDALHGKAENKTLDGEDDVGKDDEYEDIAERQYIWKKNVYGLKQKMGRIRVLHRFMWYLVYGLPKHQSPEAPQSANNNLKGLGIEAVTIKQEVDETQQNETTLELGATRQAPLTTDKLQDSSYLIGQSANQSGLTCSAAGQSEKLSEADNTVQSRKEAPIGGQEQTARSVCLEESSVHPADHSERPSESNIGNHDQSDLVIGGLKRTAGAEGTTWRSTSENRLKGLTSGESSTQVEITSAADLLAFIESGNLPEKITPLPTYPVPNLEWTAPNLESGKPNFESRKSNFKSTKPNFESDIPKLAYDVPNSNHALLNLESTLPNLESTLPNLESTASISKVNPASTFSVRQGTRNILPKDAKVYLDVMDWRRFVMPLPEYKDQSHGWCLLGDLVLSMPLITFCEVITPRYVIEGLTDYLEDPLLKLLLVKDLPDRIKNRLLEQRRYIFSLENTIDQVCSLGMGVYTPRLNENKELLAIYLCRKVSLVDTTSSQPGNFYITDKTYPSHKYYLRSLEDVEKFWFDLKVICLDTPLGFVRNLKVDSKATKGKFNGFARKVGSYLDPVIDDGRLPGDGKGAGGFDSRLYCHLKRNWTRSSLDMNYMSKPRYHNRFSKGQRNTSERLCNPLKPKTVSLSTRKGVKEQVTVETKLVNVDEHKAERVGGKGLKRKRSSKSPKPKKEASEAWIARKKRKEEKKKAKEEMKLRQRQKRAIGIVTRKVYSWTPREDSVLLLCKVASEILNTDQSFKSCVTWETVQKVFAKKVPDSVRILESKEEKAISSRSHRLMRNPEFRMNYSVCLGEVKEDKDIMGSIKPLADRRSIETASEEFEKLFNKLEAKFRFADGFDTVLPDDITSLHSNYNVVPIAQIDLTNRRFFKVENATDLKRLTLHTIVMSTLSSQSASDYDARLVFRLYEQYDNPLLHDVFLFCRSTGIVNRCRTNPKRRIVPCLPMSYQLSVGYIRLFKTRMSHELPDEASSCQEKLLKSAPEEEVTFPQVTCGACSFQIFLLSTDQVNCKIIIPQKVIIVDSNLIDQDFLKKSGLLMKCGDFSDSDSDSDEDSEEDENEEQSDATRGKNTQLDGMWIKDSEAQGIGVIDGMRNVIGVRFEGEEEKKEEEEENEKTTKEAQTRDDQQVLESLGSVKVDVDDHSVIDQLNKLAEGLANLDSELLDAIERPMSSVQVSVTDLDHSYFGSRAAVVEGSQPAADGSGDRGENLIPRSEEMLTGSGDSKDTMQEERTADLGLSLTDSRQTVDVLYGVGSVSSSRPETAGPSQAHLKPQPRNSTMKCLSDSQSSFTKWLILQGHYAPGVCGTRIPTLQENIAFNAFTVKLSLDESCPAIPGPSRPEFRPCASLLEYLLRPCKRFVPLELIQKPTELGKEASYLEELCKGKVIKHQGDSPQELRQRFTGNGLDATTTAALVQIYEEVAEAGFLGVTVSEARRIVGRVEATVTVKLSLEKYINMLLDHEMIVEVGSNELRLVATKHASLWMIHSQRLVTPTSYADSDPLAKRPCRDRLSDTCIEGPSRSLLVEDKSIEMVDLTGEPLSPQVQEGYPVESISKSEPGRRSSSPQELSQATYVMLDSGPLAERSGGKGLLEVTTVGCPEDAGEQVSEVGGATGIRGESSDVGEAALANGSSSADSDHGRAVKRKYAKVIEGVYESIEFVPQPWRKVNGPVNRPELFKMIRGTALQILAEPGIKESRIVHHLRDIFRKVDSLKLLQIMSDLGLISRHCVTLPKPSLFSRTESGSQPTIYYYHPSINCLTIIGALFDKHQDTPE